MGYVRARDKQVRRQGKAKRSKRTGGPMSQRWKVTARVMFLSECGEGCSHRERMWQETWNGRQRCDWVQTASDPPASCSCPHAQPLSRPASPSPEPEAVPVLPVVLHGRGPPARPTAASHDARPVVGIALQVPGHGELLAPHLVVGLAETAVLLVQGAEFRDGVVICRDEMKQDSVLRAAQAGPLARVRPRASGTPPGAQPRPSRAAST